MVEIRCYIPVLPTSALLRRTREGKELVLTLSALHSSRMMRNLCELARTLDFKIIAF